MNPEERPTCPKHQSTFLKVDTWAYGEPEAEISFFCTDCEKDGFSGFMAVGYVQDVLARK